MPKPVSEQLPQSRVTPDPKLEKRGRREFSPEYKPKINAVADACAHGELGALLRKEGLYKLARLMDAFAAATLTESFSR